jgi:hypothetical protein
VSALSCNGLVDASTRDRGAAAAALRAGSDSGSNSSSRMRTISFRASNSVVKSDASSGASCARVFSISTELPDPMMDGDGASAAFHHDFSPSAAISVPLPAAAAPVQLTNAASLRGCDPTTNHMLSKIGKRRTEGSRRSIAILQKRHSYVVYTVY